MDQLCSGVVVPLCGVDCGVGYCDDGDGCLAVKVVAVAVVVLMFVFWLAAFNQDDYNS